MLLPWISSKLPKTPPPRRTRLNLESLETRITPAIVNWNGAVSSLMSVAGNYAGAVAPVAGDRVIFDSAFQGLNPNFLTPIADAGLAANLGLLQLNSNYNGVVTVDRNLTVNSVSATLAMVSSSQAIRVNAGRTLTATTVSLTGTSVLGAGVLSITGTMAAPGNFVEASSSTIPTIGVGSLTIDANSSMTLNTGVKLDGVAVTNNGVIQLIRGDITTGTASMITNNGNFEVYGNNHDYATNADFTNNGFFNVMLVDPNQVLTFRSKLNNVAGVPTGGLLAVQVGNLNLLGVSTSNTNVVVLTNAVLVLRNFTADTGASFTGQGIVQVNGTLTAWGTLLVAPQVNLIGGNGLGGSLRGTGSGSFVLNGGLYSDRGRLSSTTVNAAWITVVNTAPMAGNSPALTVFNSTLTFGGGAWVSGLINVSGSQVTNTGVFQVASIDGMSRADGDTSLFDNTASGTVNFIGTGVSWFSVPFTDWGVVNLNGKSTEFKRGFNQYGGTVDLGGGAIDLAAPGLGSNAYYNLYGGRLIANGTITNARALWVDGGTLELSGTLTLTGDLRTNAGGTIQVDVTATGSGAINVTGAVTLFGNLTVNLAPGFVPPSGTKRTFLTSNLPIANFSVAPAGWKLNTPNNTLQLEKL